jgi:hypothetical protein
VRVTAENGEIKFAAVDGEQKAASGVKV